MSKAKRAKTATERFVPSDPRLTPEEIYKLAAREIPWGIEGYEIPKKYFDYHQAVWHKHRGDIIAGKVKPAWPPKDWPKDKDDVAHPPHRWNYLDDLYKWLNSYNDPAKSKELIEEKNIDVKDYVKPVVKDTKRRQEFLDNEKAKAEHKKERDAFIPEYKQEGIDTVKEKIKEHNKEREISYSERMKKKYMKGKEQMPRCDRVTIVADAEYVGEQIPFYKTPPDPDNTGNDKKLFWPDKFKTMYKAPVWRICKPSDKPDNLATRDALIKEKHEEYMNAKGLKKEDLHLQVRDAFYKVTHHGKCYMKFQKEWKPVREVEGRRPKSGYPAPNHYWKTPKDPYTQRKPMDFQTIEDSNGNKIYYLDRRKTDKRVYLSGLRKAVY